MLAGLIAGDPARGYQESRQRGQKLDAGDLDMAGMDAYGRTLATMFNAAVPGAQPMPGMPGQPSQPGAQPGQPPGQPPAPQGGPQGGFAPPPQHGMDRLRSLVQGLFQQGGGAPGGAPPGGAPGPPPGGQMGGPPGPQGGQPPMGFPQGGAPGGQPPGGAGGPMGRDNKYGAPTMDWRMIVQKVVSANPNVKDPRVIAAAVDRFLPLMNQQSQQQWREVSMMMRQQQLDISEQRARTAAEQGGARLDQGERRLDIAEGAEGRRREQGDRRLTDQEEAERRRREHGEAGIEIRRGEAERRTREGERRGDIAERRETRLDHTSTVRQDQGWQRLDMQKRDLERRITQGNDRTALAQWRAVVDAQHKRALEIINSSSANLTMRPEERKKLLEDEDKFYRDQLELMRNQQGGSAAPSRPASPQGAGPRSTWNPQTGAWE